MPTNEVTDWSNMSGIRPHYGRAARHRHDMGIRINGTMTDTLIEGAFYVWTRREFDTILGEQESSICARYWNVHRDGNVDPEDDAHDEFIHQVSGPSGLVLINQ